MPEGMGYPTTEEMGVSEETQAQPNPVIDALSAIGTFVAAQQEQGNPAAPELMAWFQKGLELMGTMGQQAEAPQEAAPKAEPYAGGRQVTPNAAPGAVAL